MWVALTAYAAMAGVALGLGMWDGRPLPLHDPSPSGALGDGADAVSIGLGALVATATVLATRWLIAHATWARELRVSFRTVLEGASERQLLLLGLFSGLAEELLFRGAIQPHAGLALTSIGFGLLHTGPSRTFLPWTLWAVAMGFVLGGIFEWTGSLYGPIVAHVAINVLNLRAIALHDPRIDHDDGRLPPPRLVPRPRVQRK